MNAHSRRKIEMGRRALEFIQAHPDTEPGSEVVVARLAQLLAQADAAATAQRDGTIHVRAASAQKQKLRQDMLEVAIPHLAEVGRAAAREEHELGKAFRFRPTAGTFLAFRTAARSMVAAAETHKEVLLKYGLSQSVLSQLVKQLDEFDAAVALGNDGRATHMGATREIRGVASEVVRTVRVMNGRSRQRFADDGGLLGSWISASTVVGEPRGRSDAEVPQGGKPADGESRPAA